MNVCLVARFLTKRVHFALFRRKPRHFANLTHHEIIFYLPLAAAERNHAKMKILVINAGSSSLKYQLFDMTTCAVLARGLCEKIGLTGAITHKRPGKPNYAEDYPMPTHNEAIALVLKLLTDPELGVIESVDEISAVGHRRFR